MDSYNNKNIFFFFFTFYASLILISSAAIIQPHSLLIKSSCSITLHPHLCYSMFSNIPHQNLKTPHDIVKVALNRTKDTVQRNYFTINKLIIRHNLTRREKIAIHDCLEMVVGTLGQLEKVIGYVDKYPPAKGIPRRHVYDILTFMSTTLTNQETCIDGFSHDTHEKHFRDSIIEGELHAGKLCSNSLAIIKNLTNTDMKGEGKGEKGRKLVGKWPKWLSAGDRRLLQSGNVTANVVVAADGSGDFTTVSAAVAAAPSGSSSRYVIRIAAGVYRENVEIPRKKTNLMFLGSGRTSTIITASRSVAGGSTTFNSATVAAVGDGFLARDLTFENTAGPSGEQAVALRVGSDLSAFYQCDMIAHQDTLYVHSNRQFYINCYIVGTVDFIFGNAAAVLQDCDIQARRPNPNQKNMVTAQGRSDPNQNTGIVIQKSRIGATSDLIPVQSSFPTYLGRPWREYSRTVVMQSTISDVIVPEGWYPWEGDFALNTLYYGEYQNTGAGADTSNRVTWRGYRVITSTTEAQGFTAGSFIGGGNWLAGTGFPFSLSL
ncbi:hypothetical protein OSB04_030380 [Centaurea solstitialis]|uniref:Pectinesterase n=1 Tax=Centaurea solstitialis TaxID=347529 RepID=A0AA38VWM6_9ASTR|nr:hypothetical protein OSB04_030380 [Centaurea solstitialis]